MVFSWFRRRRELSPPVFLPEWEPILARTVLQVRWLDAATLEKLRHFVALFLAEKRFEGCAGLAISDEMRLAIAGQAGLVTLGFAEACFTRLRSVLVYPGDYFGTRSTPLEGGGELQWKEPRLGETWNGGSMVLSWPRVVEGGRLRDGPRSVVIHECAHAIDLLDGEIDGDDPRTAGFHQVARGAAQQVGQVLVGLRPEHQVDGRRAAHHLLALGLGDAAADSNQHAAAGAGLLFLQQAQPADFRIDLFGRFLADMAGIEDHQVGVFRRIRRLIAQRRQDVGHARRVIDVHLAAIGLDMQPLLRHESILKNYGRGT